MSGIKQRVKQKKSFASRILPYDKSWCCVKKCGGETRNEVYFYICFKSTTTDDHHNNKLSIIIISHDITL